VLVGAADSRISVTVTDNGIGLGDPTELRGLANLRRRAELRDGTLDVRPGRTAGTVLTWSIPA
jgi:signal transduction histidine kinase